MSNKEQIKKSYYYSDIELSEDLLNNAIRVCEVFEAVGGERLMSALAMGSWNFDKITKLNDNLIRARHIMEIESSRVQRYSISFNTMFATNHNQYYNSVEATLRKIHSHLKPLKMILSKTCPRKHPNRKECKRYKIKSKSIMEESILIKKEYQRYLFNIEDSSTPYVVKELYHELQLFFKEEKKCFEICKNILKEEAEIRKDPQKCKALLDNYKDNAYKTLKHAILLNAKETIQTLMELNFAYERSKEYRSEEAFAQGEFHKHNVDDMNDYCQIKIAQEMKLYELDPDEMILWNNNHLMAKKVRHVIEHYDEILPKNFKQKMMGKFQYYLSVWAQAHNVKKFTDYFIKHYKGKYHPSKYKAVNHHSRDYFKNKETEAKQFFQTIENMLNTSGISEFNSTSA